MTGLPDFVIIGGMKCGTTALHDYLGRHPEISVSDPKELNFFFGPDGCPDAPTWADGNWWRGVDWYVRRLGDGKVRGEASPGYTSPRNPEAATRMAAVLPDARLLYLVRDPLDRALSQYLHHRRDGDERRPPEDALLDPHSQYIARSRYAERLEPFLAAFDRDQILVVAHEALRDHRRRTLADIFAFVGVDPTFWTAAFQHRRHVAGGKHPLVSDRARTAFEVAVADDAARLRRLIDQGAAAVARS